MTFLRVLCTKVVGLHVVRSKQISNLPRKDCITLRFRPLEPTLPGASGGGSILFGRVILELCGAGAGALRAAFELSATAARLAGGVARGKDMIDRCLSTLLVSTQAHILHVISRTKDAMRCVNLQLSTVMT